ncbi:DUF7662 domain-containing protein [Clostridium estertheticum]|uniref:DUF7662 domain-containing protein n=1 Tax=Clostridium estertheticum TaxID=238834 RepID=UPI001CF502B8|nr:hypothetical protein [Clostridium estertheticum]MCB2339091.1 hypothetical protein [Clostridium estertheticum]
MPKGDKYVGLTNYLKGKKENHSIMSFSDIEEQVGAELPGSAYKYREFWSNSYSHSVAFGWLDAGYKTISVDFKENHVTFYKE